MRRNIFIVELCGCSVQNTKRNQSLQSPDIVKCIQALQSVSTDSHVLRVAIVAVYRQLDMDLRLTPLRQQ